MLDKISLFMLTETANIQSTMKIQLNNIDVILKFLIILAVLISDFNKHFFKILYTLFLHILIKEGNL